MRSAAPHEEISPDPTIPEEANARARTRDGAAAVPRESSPAAAVEEGRKLVREECVRGLDKRGLGYGTRHETDSRYRAAYVMRVVPHLTLERHKPGIPGASC